MLLHRRQMHCITRGHLPAPHHNLFRALGGGPVHGQHLIGDAKQSIECGAAEGRLAAMFTLTGMEAAKVGIDIAQAGDRLVTKA